MFFECNEAITCECEMMDRPLDIDSWTKAREATFVTHRDLSDVDERTRVQHEWHAFVRAYSRLHLTFVGDRLPALSGLAKAAMSRREDHHIPTGRYLAGLFEKSLLNDMAWCVGKQMLKVRKEGRTATFGGVGTTESASKPRPEEYVAPTWSWASVLDPVEYAPYGYTTFLCTVLEARTSLVDQTTGRVSGGSIILRGNIQPSRWGWVTPSFSSNYYALLDIKGTITTLKIRSDEGMRWYPDYDITAEAKHRLSEQEMLYLLPLVSRPILSRESDSEFSFRFYPGKTITETAYLVLRRAGSAAVPVFERVGWAEYTGSSKGPAVEGGQESRFMLV